MVGEIAAGLGGLKSALDIVKGLKDMSDAAARNAVAIELQEKLLRAYEAHTALLERVGELEKEVTRLKDWEAEKQRYELIELAPGIVCYAIKPTMQGSEPMHRICANCCAKGKKSYLQQHIRGPDFDEYKCHECGEVLGINKGTPPQPRSDYDPFGNDFMTR